MATFPLLELAVRENPAGAGPSSTTSTLTVVAPVTVLRSLNSAACTAGKICAVAVLLMPCGVDKVTVPLTAVSVVAVLTPNVAEVTFAG